MILVTTSKLAKYLLFALCLSFVTSFVIGNGIPCTKTECGCWFKNKTGTYEISMASISKHGESFFPNVPGDYWKYDIDPCYGFTKISTDCKDVTMCQHSPSQSIPIAYYDISSYTNFIDENTAITVIYSPVTYNKKKRQMKINLKCSKSGVVSRSKVSETKGDVFVYTLEISSPVLCPKNYTRPSDDDGSSGGISTGSVMVIIFFGLLVVYVVAGMLFMKYRRGATGKEIIPNIEFWSSLPGLIKDGCVFFGKNMKELCGRCCQREGYSEI